MGVSHQLSSLAFEIRIIGARNIEIKSSEQLFVRCYLSAGEGNKVRLDSQDISSKSHLSWDESFSLQCLGTPESVNRLMGQSVVFELRCRSTASFLRKIGGSRLLGRAEVPWKSVFESPENDIEKWVIMVPKSRSVNEDIKPPAIKVSIKVQVEAPPKGMPERRRRRTEVLMCDECGCRNVIGSSFPDYDMFAGAAGLECS